MKKKDYVKPEIIHTEPIEGIAGACGGGKAHSGTCQAGPIAS
ncbi:MAG TPA: hypothetical protein PK014_11905 [Thermoanaerobaculia bacterium]|nr:hypothetical protein [Thermoanaerobaculia bacterium]HUM28814.1 hypothetical protein [Thermoanaerobaculia bacterium]HXK69071.1 hypothetical protein [Thermoanaerobaculia bacterium]